MKKIRYAWIDNAKFLSIFLVVLFHCPPPFYGYTNIFLGHLRIPLFFFVAGLLFRFDKYSSALEFIKHRSKQLLIPYFSFFILFYLFWIFLGRDLSGLEGVNTPLYQPIVEYLYGRPYTVCWPLWFIACLFTMQCLFFLFKKIKRPIASVIILLLPLIPEFIDLSNSPWMLDNVFFYIPYYGIASMYKKEILELMNRKSKAFVSLIVFSISVGITFLLADIDQNYIKTAVNSLCRFGIIIPFLIFIKYFSDRYNVRSLIKYISKNTIIVLACHTYAIKIFILFFTWFLAYGEDFFDDKYLLKTVMAIIVMLLMLIPIYIINRYFPFILGKSKYSNQEIT